MLNCLFVRDVLTKSTISPFQNYFNKSEIYTIIILDTLNKTLSYLTQRSITFSTGNKSIPHHSEVAWNKLQKETHCNLLQEVRSATKRFITNKILNSY